MSYYIINKETQKLEMHFDKADYMSLPDADKQKIKSNFLFSRYAGAWVSRAKFPNLYRAEQIAKGLGLENAGKVGETLTFAEQMERKAERAEARADRYEAKAEKAEKEGKRLQAPIDSMHGDISFFTQPNINTSAGRAFTRQRERMWAAWEKGFEEFRKAGYYADRAEAARNAVKKETPDFCQRRMDEAEKTIRAQKKNLDHYHKIREAIDAGKAPRGYGGNEYNAADVDRWIEDAEEIIDQAMGKYTYYREMRGEVVFNRDNIKPGYMVELNKHWKGTVTVLSTGPKNFVYDAGNGFRLKASYAEIVKIVKAVKIEDQEPQHPFKVGDVFTAKVWTGDNYEKKEFTVTKITADKVTTKCGDARAITRQPRKCPYDNNVWALSLGDDTVYKKAE